MSYICLATKSQNQFSNNQQLLSMCGNHGIGTGRGTKTYEHYEYESRVTVKKLSLCMHVQAGICGFCVLCISLLVKQVFLSQKAVPHHRHCESNTTSVKTKAYKLESTLASQASPISPPVLLT